MGAGLGAGMVGSTGGDVTANAGAGGGADALSVAAGGGVPCVPSACGVGTFRVAPTRSVLGLPLLNAAGLPAIRIAIICGMLTAVEGRTRLATAVKVSPRRIGP